MAARNYINGSPLMTLSVLVNTAATTLTVGSTAGTPTAPFVLALERATVNEEIVLCTAKTATTFTVTRAYDGTTAKSHGVGAAIEHATASLDYQEPNFHINDVTHDQHTQYQRKSTLTTKGDLFVATAPSVTNRLGAGGDNTVLIADSGLAAGLKYALIPTASIADAAVTSAKIADGAVVTIDLADGAVTSAKILDATILGSDIATGTITSANITDLTIATGDIADGAITTAKILDGTITGTDIASGTITSGNILDGTIANADISASAAISYSKLSLGSSITSADIVNGTITGTDIASATIGSANMANESFVSYTPTLVGITLGPGGSVTARRALLGNICFFHIDIDMGGSGWGLGISSATVTVPFAAQANWQHNYTINYFNYAAGLWYSGNGVWASTTTFKLFANFEYGIDYMAWITPDIPFTWNNNCRIMINGWYERA